MPGRRPSPRRRKTRLPTTFCDESFVVVVAAAAAVVVDPTRFG